MKIAFEDLEKEYLAIDEPFDLGLLEELYTKHKYILDQTFFDDNEQQEKAAAIILEIGDAYSFSKKHSKAIALLERGLIMAQNASGKYAHVNRAYFSLGYSYFNTSRYIKALANFKKYRKNPDDDNDYTLLIELCRKRIKENTFIIAAAIGLILIITKYFIKWFFPEYYGIPISILSIIGSILLLCYGIFSFRNR
jgi:tetratricopeptide (TPR) repeat protein